MNYSTYRFTLDIHKTKSQVSISALFQDTGSQIYINLTDGGKPYKIAEGCKAVLFGRKPLFHTDTGKYDTLIEDCEIIDDGTRIRYVFSDQTTTQLGSVACEIRLYSKEGKQLTSPAFEILVGARVIEDDEIIESQDERTALDRIFESEAAREDAETQRENAETEREKDFQEALKNFNEKLQELRGQSYAVDHQYIVCNYKDKAGVSSGLVMLTGEYDISDGFSRYQSAYGIIYDAKNTVLRHGRGCVKTEVEPGFEDDTPYFYFGYVEENQGEEYFGGVRVYEEEGEIVGADIPLIVDEVLDIPALSENIKIDYANSIDKASLSREPKIGEKFWCLIKTKDDYIFSAVAEITNTINVLGYYPFKLTEAYVIYDPTETLHLKSETEQVVDSDVKFKKDVTVEGDLNVLGEYTTSEVQSLIVKDRFIVCNDGKSTLSSGIIIRKGDLLEDGMVNAYNAYGIILDPDTGTVRLGRGYVSNDYPYLGYVPSFTFGYVEQDSQGHLKYTNEQGQAISTRSDSGDITNGNLVKWDAENKKLTDSGKSIEDIGVSIEDIIQINTKTGNLVKWDATQNKLVDTGCRLAEGAVGNTVVVRNANGVIYAKGGVGSPNSLMSVEGVQKALSFRSVDSFTERTSSYIYNYGQFRAKGWVGNGTNIGEITDLPADNDWAQRIINASDSDKFLRIRGALKHDNDIYYSDHVFLCTDKATIDSLNTRNGDLAINIKANSSIYINSIYTENSAMRIYIT